MMDSRIGEGNCNWKGDDASYGSLHDWVRRWKEITNTCSSCGKKCKTTMHNISGEYRRDVNDYEELCSFCHSRKDGNRLHIDNEAIRRMYFDEKLSTYEISSMFGICERTISNRIKKEMGLNLRSKSEAIKLGRAHQLRGLPK